MDKNTLTSYLMTQGKRHTSLGEFWADLMNQTRGQVVSWLVDAGIKDMNQLKQYLRPAQIANAPDFE